MYMHVYVRISGLSFSPCLLLQPLTPLTKTPLLPAPQLGPLIGGPGLSHQGNCTKANKGVEQSGGNTVTQRDGVEAVGGWGVPSTVEDFRKVSYTKLSLG